MKNICPVCYFDDLFEPPYDNRGIGSYEICPCCGFQFGYDDFPNKKEQIILWREKWLAEGSKWFSKCRKPKGEDSEEQN